MRGVVLHAPGDVRVEERDRSRRSSKPTDAIIRLSATCVCGSDLWPYRGIEPVSEPRPMGHEYVGIVEEVGSRGHAPCGPGEFVVGSFFASDNTCEICRAGYQTSCVHRESGRRDRRAGRVDARPAGRRHPGRHARAADARPGPEPAGRVRRARYRVVRRRRRRGRARARPSPWSATARSGCSASSPRRQLGAERIIAMSRHEPRQELAREFGATDIVTERGDEGVARIKELTGGLGAHSVIEAVGTQESMMQAIGSTRPGGHVGFVGVAHGVELPGDELFFSHVHLHGGPAPVRRFLPELIELIWSRQIDPGKVFDLTLPLDAGRRGLPGDGRAPRHQGAAAPLTSDEGNQRVQLLSLSRR